MTKPHFSLRYTRPDEAAECWNGILAAGDLYEALWACVPKYKKIDYEDNGPHDVLGINSIQSFWHSFTETQKRALNEIAAKQEQY